MSKTNLDRFGDQVARLRLADARDRYQARRESGGAWAVIDTRTKNAPVATGIDDMEEAEQTAAAWNKKKPIEKPVTTAQPKAEAAKPVQKPTLEQKPQLDLKPLIEAVKADGWLTALPQELSTMLHLPATNQAGLLSMLEPKCSALHANGIRFFAHTGKGSYGAITFRMLALDTLPTHRTP